MSSENSKSEKKFKAHELASKQRDIGVAEFFARNKHLLGFVQMFQ